MDALPILLEMFAENVTVSELRFHSQKDILWKGTGTCDCYTCLCVDSTLLVKQRTWRYLRLCKK